MNKTPNAAEILSQVSALLNVLTKHGLSDEKILESKRFFLERLACFWKNGITADKISLTETEKQAAARIIMGQNFIGLPELYSMIWLTQEERSALEIIPFNMDVLASCSETHLLVTDPGFSVQDMQEITPQFFETGTWVYHQKTSRTRTTPSWHLIRKEFIPGSTGKKWEQRQEVLSEDEQIPSARTLLWMMIVLQLKGVNMMESLSVYTDTLAFDDYEQITYQVFILEGILFAMEPTLKKEEIEKQLSFISEKKPNQT